MQLNPMGQTTSPISIRTRCQLALRLIARVLPVTQSYLLLFRFEVIMCFRSSEALRRIVRNEPVRHSERLLPVTSGVLCHAMDLACVFYLKRVLCLQRSAATVVLLRRHGWNAEMVTGAQILPFEAHAWVEIANDVVNDKPYMHEIYQVLERY